MVECVVCKDVMMSQAALQDPGYKHILMHPIAHVKPDLFQLSETPHCALLQPRSVS